MRWQICLGTPTQVAGVTRTMLCDGGVGRSDFLWKRSLDRSSPSLKWSLWSRMEACPFVGNKETFHVIWVLQSHWRDPRWGRRV